ncbi:lipopolysaccharide biosynthesis protein [Sphingomonas sp. 28-63-12]|uniref:lipopolysaccharide biosynthesis protein n=1 Tax=Sphingomonas sp. 28-63-12 TaxID=1970434 RepID=UPI000BC89B1C|nr:MAG: lipopolysaccharide biosynthesis protein [Sphingomonas sp. 28-63-12]
MLGVIIPKAERAKQPAGAWQASVKKVFFLYRHFILFVVLPTTVVAAYYYLIASDQYETGADFVIRKADVTGSQVGAGQILGFSLGVSAVSPEAYIVNDYLLSTDAMQRLRKKHQLVERYTRPSIDLFSRLWQDNPTPERLLKYYRNHVAFSVDSETGITRMTVHAFTPDDAYEIGNALLRMGEEQINQLNIRTYRDQVLSARNEATLAATALQQAEQALTSYRRTHNDIDPEGSGKAQVTLVSNLTAGLTTARARLAAMDGRISKSSPQYQAMLGQVSALEAQVAGQSRRIAAGDKSIASLLGGYESLQVQRETAVRRYAAAAAAYETTRSEAERKQNYVIQIVDANRAVKPLYPERGKIVGTFLLTLVFAYAIGWLLVQGVREHQV